MDIYQKNSMNLPYLNSNGNEAGIYEKEYDLNENNWKAEAVKSWNQNNGGNNNCGCGGGNNGGDQDDMMPDLGDCEAVGRKMVVAMAYVPNQKWNEIYCDEVGFSRGTIFPELDKPFIGEGGMMS